MDQQDKHAVGTEEAFAGELEMLRAVVANLPDLIYVKDAQSRFMLANQGTCAVMSAGSPALMMGKTDFDFYPHEVAAAFFEDEQKIVDSHQPLVSREECIREADGRLRYILTTKVPWLAPDGSVNGIIGIGRNITAIKEAEAELERVREDLRFKATHDSLTELLNREAILEMLTRELARTTREKGCLTVVLVDVDHFKSVNDTHGHQVGDAVLRETARRLQKAVRTYDLVGRYGGEEFLVILTNCAGPEAVLRANQMRHAVQELPMQTPGGDILMTISAGVLTTRERSDQTAEQILRDVDVALYEAKNAGRNCCRLARPARKSNS